MSIVSHLLRTTIRIESQVPGGISTGTGFFFNFCFDKKTGQGIPAIVTNKHVIKDSTIGKFRFPLADNNGNSILGKTYDVSIEKFEGKWILHPDVNVDLCIFPIAPILNSLKNPEIMINYAILSKEDLLSADDLENSVSSIEDITMVGYPDGIWDNFNNMPIVRQGITATPLNLDFKNEPKFLIDAAIYGGSSGSPVYLFNRGSYPQKNGGICIGNRLKLVGIVSQVFQHSITGSLHICPIPTNYVQNIMTAIPNNLGIVIHARKLLDFEKILYSLLKEPNIDYATEKP